MAFNFDLAMERAKKDASSTALEAIILGPSGAGKSYLAGTFGVKTLYLYTQGETHGVKAAKALAGNNLIPVCFDYATMKDPDASLAALLEILEDTKKLQALGVEAIYVDGAMELEYLIRKSASWSAACETKKGDHNTFEEGRATIAAYRPIFLALKTLQREYGMHIALSCGLDVKEIGSFGDIVECSPRLQGYAVAEALIQQFGDVLVVGSMEKDGVRKHKLQFMSDIGKTSKDDKGTIKKTINFKPRLSGVPAEKLPPYMDASLALIGSFKEKHFGGAQ